MTVYKLLEIWRPMLVACGVLAAAGTALALDNTMSNEFWNCLNYTNAAPACSTGAQFSAVLDTRAVTSRASLALPVFDSDAKYGVVIVFR